MHTTQLAKIPLLSLTRSPSGCWLILVLNVLMVGLLGISEASLYFEEFTLCFSLYLSYFPSNLVAYLLFPLCILTYILLTVFVFHEKKQITFPTTHPTKLPHFSNKMCEVSYRDQKCPLHKGNENNTVNSGFSAFT